MFCLILRLTSKKTKDQSLRFENVLSLGKDPAFVLYVGLCWERLFSAALVESVLKSYVVKVCTVTKPPREF